MYNNDILIRLRYALDVKDTDMVKIFMLGGIKLKKEDVLLLLEKADKGTETKIESKAETRAGTKADTKTETKAGAKLGTKADTKVYKITCTNHMLESFLNGLITLKRGRQETTDTGKESSQNPNQNPAQKTGANPLYLIKENTQVNNIVLKKLKIALSLTSDDVLAIFVAAGTPISKGELSAVFRKEGHRNYKVCGDSYVRNFLKGLAVKYRK